MINGMPAATVWPKFSQVDLTMAPKSFPPARHDSVWEKTSCAHQKQPTPTIPSIGREPQNLPQKPVAGSWCASLSAAVAATDGCGATTAAVLCSYVERRFA